MMIVRCRHISIPLYWELLDNNSGNSNTDERIDLLKKCIRLLGGRIGLLLGDREFIGHRWLKFLKDQGIRFCVRVPRHHKITRQVGLDDQVHTVEQLLQGRKTLQLRACSVDGIWGNVYVKVLKDGDLLFLFGTAKVEFLAQLYKKRWQIECSFQNVKKRGFDLEATHLTDLDKLKKLVALVSIAYAIVASMGLHQHLHRKPIAIKNHGYKENSFSPRGIDIVREGLRSVWKRNFQFVI